MVLRIPGHRADRASADRARGRRLVLGVLAVVAAGSCAVGLGPAAPAALAAAASGAGAGAPARDAEVSGAPEVLPAAGQLSRATGGRGGLTAALAASTVLAQTAVTVTGTLHPVTELPVAVQRWTAGRWRTLTHARVALDGRYTVTVPVGASGLVRYRAALVQPATTSTRTGAAGTGATGSRVPGELLEVSAPVTADVVTTAFTVSLHRAPRTAPRPRNTEVSTSPGIGEGLILPGDVVTVTGFAAPADPGELVVVQQAEGTDDRGTIGAAGSAVSSWSTVARTRLGPDSTFTARVPVTSAGQLRLRAVVEAQSPAPAGRAPSTPVEAPGVSAAWAGVAAGSSGPLTVAVAASGRREVPLPGTVTVPAAAVLSVAPAAGRGAAPDHRAGERAAGQAGSAASVVTVTGRTAVPAVGGHLVVSGAVPGAPGGVLVTVVAVMPAESTAEVRGPGGSRRGSRRAVTRLTVVPASLGQVFSDFAVADPDAAAVPGAAGAAPPTTKKDSHKLFGITGLKCKQSKNKPTVKVSADLTVHSSIDLNVRTKYARVQVTVNPTLSGSITGSAKLHCTYTGPKQTQIRFPLDDIPGAFIIITPSAIFDATGSFTLKGTESLGFTAAITVHGRKVTPSAGFTSTTTLELDAQATATLTFAPVITITEAGGLGLSVQAGPQDVATASLKAVTGHKPVACLDDYADLYVKVSAYAHLFKTATGTLLKRTFGHLSIKDTCPPPPSPPVVTTTSLPTPTAAHYYAVTIAAKGTGPLHWAVTAGQLPTGLFLDPLSGTLSGVPQYPSTAKFTITVTGPGGKGTKSVKKFTVKVVVQPGDPHLTGNLSGIPGTAMRVEGSAQCPTPPTGEVAYFQTALEDDFGDFISVGYVRQVTADGWWSGPQDFDTNPGNDGGELDPSPWSSDPPGTYTVALQCIQTADLDTGEDTEITESYPSGIFTIDDGAPKTVTVTSAVPGSAPIGGTVTVSSDGGPCPAGSGQVNIQYGPTGGAYGPGDNHNGSVTLPLPPNRIWGTVTLPVAEADGAEYFEVRVTCYAAANVSEYSIGSVLAYHEQDLPYATAPAPAVPGPAARAPAAPAPAARNPARGPARGAEMTAPAVGRS